MPKLLQIKTYTFNIKVALALFLLSIFLLSILFLLIVPKMQKEQYDQTKKRIEQMIDVTKEQVMVAGDAIQIQSILEKKETKYALQLAIEKIKQNSFNIEDTKKQILQSNIVKHCSYLLKNNTKQIQDIKELLYLEKFQKPIYDTWQKKELDKIYRSLSRKTKYWEYSALLKYENTSLSIFCKESNLNKNHASFEREIKKNVQKTFALTHKFHKGKTYLMWLNPQYRQEQSRPLYEEDKELRRQRYTISNMSNVKNIHTGDLTARQIVQAMDKEPLLHNLNGKKALTWIKDLSEKDAKYTFMLVTTIYLEDLHTHVDSTFWKILPAALTALLLSIFAGFFLFKRLFKGINILADTAKEVNMGNKNIRSNVKGNDDIGHLGVAFDSMLDSLQQNIKTLDSKVEKKTKELKDSLNEKEILLKEIHHRVKNNLALTIGLIKLQQAKIKDDKTKNILKDVQERIYTMELLHRKLYESTNLNHINFKEYVYNLTQDISASYNYENKVDIKIKIEEIFLTIETAMPCGLVINEIITNAFKYAFKEHDNPKLTIEMKRKKEKYLLKIKDNGKGLDENIDISNSSTLGLKLINTICKLQLNGDIKYSYKKGAIFEIEF